MTNTILSAIMYIQIVTNWGPIENFDKNVIWMDSWGKNPYSNSGHDRRQHANVESQEVVQVTLPDGRSTTNIMKSKVIEEINKTGRIVEYIEWYSTNVNKMEEWVITGYTNSNSIYTMTNSFCTSVSSALINTSSNKLNLDETAELVEYAKKQKWIRAEPERAGLWTKISGTAGYYWDKMTAKNSLMMKLR